MSHLAQTVGIDLVVVSTIDALPIVDLETGDLETRFEDVRWPS
jgi:hypothetical protein